MFENMWRDLYNDLNELQELETNVERKSVLRVIIKMMDIYLDSNLNVYLDTLYKENDKKQG